MFKKLLRKILPAPVAAIADEALVEVADEATHGAVSKVEKVVKGRKR